jgi:hypothetical protein
MAVGCVGKRTIFNPMPGICFVPIADDDGTGFDFTQHRGRTNKNIHQNKILHSCHHHRHHSRHSNSLIQIKIRTLMLFSMFVWSSAQKQHMQHSITPTSAHWKCYMYIRIRWQEHIAPRSEQTVTKITTHFQCCQCDVVMAFSERHGAWIFNYSYLQSVRSVNSKNSFMQIQHDFVKLVVMKQKIGQLQIKVLWLDYEIKN